MEYLRSSGAEFLSASLRAGRWTARSARSIKYEFIVVTPIAAHLDANSVA